MKINRFLNLNAIIPLPLVPQISDGQVIDAVPVMALANYIAAAVNANAQPITSGPVLAQWQYLGVNGTFISTTSFSVPGNYTTILTPGLKLQTTNTGGTGYAYVSSSSFGGGITTVTSVYLAGVALDAGLSTINIGILGGNPINSAIQERSVIQVLWGHNADTIVTNTANTICTNNGFSLVGINFGGAAGNYPISPAGVPEFNTATGVFTPSRFGFYIITMYVQLNTTGVTFSGASQIGNNLAGALGSPVNPDFYANVQANRASAVNAYMNGLFSGTENMALKVNFSAGTPVFVQGVHTIIGPI